MSNMDKHMIRQSLRMIVILVAICAFIMADVWKVANAGVVAWVMLVGLLAESIYHKFLR